MKNYLLLLALFAFAFSFQSCDDDDPEPENEEELITTLIYNLVPTDGSDRVELRFTDADGDGGNAPVFSTAPLKANTIYTGEIRVLDESQTPAESITEEIREEDDEHQFFFANNLGMMIDYEDSDGTGFPIGLMSTLTTASAGTGTLTITLRHEPTKNAPNVSAGDISEAGGETDIEVTFDVEVQ